MKNNVKRIKFSSCSHWVIDDAIYHESKRFFSIIGIKGQGYEKILIKQEEVGILGLLVTSEEGNNHFLVQRKAEPGNIPMEQWAPTVQATKSNYERVHNGKSTPYIDLFLQTSARDIRGSEQGDKFYNKFNLNAIREIGQKEEPINDLYFWTDAAELKAALKNDFSVNTDLRSVIATSDWTIYKAPGRKMFINNDLSSELQSSFHESYHFVRDRILDQTQGKLKLMSCEIEKDWEVVPLEELRTITVEEEGLFLEKERQLVGYFDVELKNREVARWQQPLLCPISEETSTLCFKIENDMAWFYLRAYHEIGFLNRMEYGPSVQTGLSDQKIDRTKYEELRQEGELLISLSQTDEGGRFFQNQHRYEVIFLGAVSAEYFSEDSGVWVSLGELEQLCHQSGLITNELRTCISLLISFV